MISSSYLNDTFHYTVDTNSRVIRNTHLFVPKVKTTLAMNFYFRGKQIWNSLNPTLYEVRKLADFKSIYKALLCTYVIVYLITVCLSGHCWKAVHLPLNKTHSFFLFKIT